ncbi:hypothetical protein PORY_001842 [Pneumocystis oryctolagi]|uniref:Uncharacterized protein n=1 Tax=Pneumocystis oryctolagi TaxID=42067 RepID=A0ACB7CHL1_9ASCO|nr:hypothetical protein PORY_001842 [Pneumocystis oryctolagi]
MAKYGGEVGKMKNSGRMMSFEKVKGGENEGTTESRAQLNLKNLQHVPCKFYRQGMCTAGRNCPFSHNLNLESEGAPCKYFQKGNCKFGAKCALAHVYLDGRRSETQALAFPYGLNYGISEEMKQTTPMLHSYLLQETLSNAPATTREYNFFIDDNLMISNKLFSKENNIQIPQSSTFTNHSELMQSLESSKDTSFHETRLSPNFNYNKTYFSNNEILADSVSTKFDYPDISSLSLSGKDAIHSSLQHKNTAISPLLDNPRRVFSDNSSLSKFEKTLKTESDLTHSIFSNKFTDNNNNIYNVSSFFSKDTWYDPWKNSASFKNSDEKSPKSVTKEKISPLVSQKSFTFNEFQFQKTDDNEVVSNINFRSNPSSFGTSPSSRFCAFFSKYSEYSDNMVIKNSPEITSYHEFVQPYYNEYNYCQTNELQIPSVMLDATKRNNISFSKNLFSPLEQKLSEKINQNGLSTNSNGIVKKTLITVDDETQFHMDEEIPENTIL